MYCCLPGTLPPFPPEAGSAEKHPRRMLHLILWLRPQPLLSRRGQQQGKRHQAQRATAAPFRQIKAAILFRELDTVRD
jgi:hypothetical protein